MELLLKQPIRGGDVYFLKSTLEIVGIFQFD